MPRGEPPPGLRARRRRRRTAAAPSEPSTRQVARGQRPPVTGHDQGERSELRYRHARQQGDPGQRPTAERGLVQLLIQLQRLTICDHPPSEVSRVVPKGLSPSAECNHSAA